MTTELMKEIRDSNGVAIAETTIEDCLLQRQHQDIAIFILLQQVEANGGATADPVLLTGLEISRGFAVGRKDTGFEMPLNEVGSLTRELALEVLQIRMSAVKEGRFIGLWRDKETDELCFEHSTIFDCLEEAIETARKEEQKSIYDFVEGRDRDRPDFL